MIKCIVMILFWLVLCLASIVAITESKTVVVDYLGIFGVMASIVIPIVYLTYPIDNK